jgi:hypothetical protein
MQGPNILTGGIITRMLELERQRFFLVHLCNAERQKASSATPMVPARLVEAIPEKLTFCGSTAANSGIPRGARRVSTDQVIRRCADIETVAVVGDAIAHRGRSMKKLIAALICASFVIPVIAEARGGHYAGGHGSSHTGDHYEKRH